MAGGREFSGDGVYKGPDDNFFCIEGPNGTGKSTIGLRAIHATIANLAHANEMLGNGRISPEVWMVGEPPMMRMGGENGDETYRSYLKGGKAKDSIVQLALFLEGRRKLQEIMFLNKYRTTRISDLDVWTRGLETYGGRAQKRGMLVMGDRGTGSSRIFQVRGLREKGDIENAEYCERMIIDVYSQRWLIPYDLVVFMFPDAELENVKTGGVVDAFEGKYKEVAHYAAEYREESWRQYARNAVWLENDPTGKRLHITMPMMAMEAVIMASVLFGNLKIGQKYSFPYLFDEEKYEYIHQSSSDRVNRRNNFLYGREQYKCGNVVLKAETKFRFWTQMELELTDRMPGGGKNGVDLRGNWSG